MPESARGDFLDRACAEDPALREKVEALIAAERGAQAIDQAIGEAAEGVSDLLATGRAPLESGARLGRYEIISPAGKGGMGHVYRARDQSLGREVALKLLNPILLATEAGRSSFEREARAVAALRHPNLVTIHDVGEADGQPFIVMEMIEGETLREKMRRAPDEGEYLPWVIQIADGLAAAHEAGVVHRDLKPDNVIIDADGTARIIDFGVARLDERMAAASDRVATDPEGPMGTLGYLSPESASGQGADHRADQFSLGAILYEFVSRETPIRGDTPQELFEATLEGARVDSERLAGAPAGLHEIIERCLKKDPAHRYPDTYDLLADLRRLAPFGSIGMPPSPRTRLIGRDTERDAIRRLIVDERRRLVTLTGPGGCGKTRLALQVMNDLRDHFGSRIFFVELAAIREAGLVVPTIARALGETGDRPSLDALSDLLPNSAEPCLVVLDNFEQVVAAAPEVGELLAKLDNVSLLVTSREVLRLYGEHDITVEPLASPPPSSGGSIEKITAYPAVTLFTERARAINAAFQLGPANAAQVAELCRRLDGLPLALELAAARSRTLSPGEILARLESWKGLLAAGARDAPERHRTLRATLDWSYELVDEREGVLFRRLGVFAGGFTLEAAEAVANGYGDLGVDVVDGMASLVDKSLVQVVPGFGDETRYTLLETVSEFARDKLAEHDELERTRRAHAAYFVLLAEEGGAELARAPGAEWLQRFRLEHDNCRAALDWLTETGAAEWGLRLALGLFDFWDRTGYVIEGELRFGRLLALAESHRRKRLRARGLFAAAAFAASRAVLEVAVDLQEEALELYREVGDLRGQAVVLNGIGIRAATNGFDYAKARDAFTRALEIWSQLEDRTAYARSLSNLAWVLKCDGEYKEAQDRYRQAGEVFAAEGNAIDAVWAVNHEADVLAEAGEPESAAALYQDALDRFEALGYAWGGAATMADLATLAAQGANWKSSTRWARRALERFVDLGHERGMARLFEVLAVAAAADDRAETSLALVAGATVLRHRHGVALAPTEQTALDTTVAQMRERAGETAAQAAWTRGEATTLEALVRLALEG